MTTMQRMNFNARWAAPAALAMTVAACGGGGGDSGATVVVPAAVSITAGNQDDVARASALAAQGGLLGGSATLASDGGSGVKAAAHENALALPASAQPLVTALAHANTAVLRQLRAAPLASGRETIAAVSSQNVACAVSGSITVSIDDVDNSQNVSVGDVLTITFNACSDVAGETLGGSVAAGYTSIQTTPTISIGASLAFNNLSATVQGGSASYNGALALSYSEPTATTAVSALTVSSPLTVAASRTGVGAYTDSVTLQAGFSLNSTHNSSLAQTSGTVNGSVSSSRAGGTVQISTLKPVVQRDVDLYPSSGQILATGQNSALRTTVQNTSTVLIELDADGNGSFESSKTVPWGTLI
jgi:hypothetical protein